MLIENFRQHRAEFEKLALMAEMETVHSISADKFAFIDHRTRHSEISGLRVGEYQYQVGLTGVEGYPGRSLLNRAEGVFFPISTDWIVPKGFSYTIEAEKGYILRQGRPERLVESLDGLAFKDDGISYRKIDEHWYLYYLGSSRCSH